VQENWLELQAVFNKNASYVLATITGTQGPTYRKPGTMMLIDADGKCTGLLSGGCLEADIALHAQEVLLSNKTMLLTYDLKADAELLWGLGLGCDGVITILLQPLTPTNSHLDFIPLLSAIATRKPGCYQQNITDKQAPFARFVEQEAPCLTLDNDKISIPVIPPISIAICGAGPDAEPVVYLAQQLGWNIHLWDHRKQYLAQPCFNLCQHKLKIRAEQASSGNFKDLDAIVIMSHNLANDSQFLAKSLAENVNYIGLLGPMNRRDKIFSEHQIKSDDVKGQIYGPVGLELGGRSPQAIALSIVAEIQQHFTKVSRIQ
jgi:xanthine dehydrogenase accessory factor